MEDLRARTDEARKAADATADAAHAELTQRFLSVAGARSVRMSVGPTCVCLVIHSTRCARFNGLQARFAGRQFRSASQAPRADSEYKGTVLPKGEKGF